VHLETGELVDHQPPQPSHEHDWDHASKRWYLCPSAQNTIDRRMAAQARIAVLEASQHRFVREHCLGKPSAVERLREIDAEISKLSAEL
jgi:hypothetical protein